MKTGAREDAPEPDPPATLNAGCSDRPVHNWSLLLLAHATETLLRVSLFLGGPQIGKLLMSDRNRGLSLKDLLPGRAGPRRAGNHV